MKKIAFTKMVGAGNDFLVLEGSSGSKPGLSQLAVAMCDRTDGIGADGLLILDKSRKADYKMRIINADGSEAEMCGNGARCLAAYIVANKKPKKKTFTLETLAGIVSAQAKGETAEVTLSDPKDYRPGISIPVNGRDMTVSYIDTGVPHTVIFVHDLKKIDVATIGASVRHHEAFKPRGTNVNFVEFLDQDTINCRTFERGVEDETRACGTGSVAAAIISYLRINPQVKDTVNAQMNVQTKSGEVLSVSFDKTAGRYHHVKLKGSAKFIAKGEYYC